MMSSPTDLAPGSAAPWRGSDLDSPSMMERLNRATSRSASEARPVPGSPSPASARLRRRPTCLRAHSAATTPG